MSFFKEFNPLQWPPDIPLADLHSRCSMPGKENPEGEMCPCCSKKQKLRTTNWPSRDIYKDFKNFGGGVPSYFGLLFYYGIAITILIVLTVGFHIYCQRLVCQEATAKECISAGGPLILMTTTNIIANLQTNHQTLAIVMLNLNFVVFLYLLAVNFGVHYYLKFIERKITKRITVLSKFSIFLKNISKSENMESVKAMMLEIQPKAEIKEVFFLQKVSQYEDSFNAVIDSYFMLKYLREEKNLKALAKEQQNFEKCYKQFKISQLDFRAPTGRAIVIFQNSDHKNKVQAKLEVSDITKFCHHSYKLVNMKTDLVKIYADKMHEPGEVLWKYIGDSSVFKTKVRIQTTVVSLAFLVFCYALLSFPIVFANDEQSNQGHGSVWNFTVSITLVIMSTIYRLIMNRLSETRKPNTHQSKAMFVLLTTVLFHICFYLIIPVIYFERQDSITKTEKLKSLIIQLLTFLAISVLLASIDIRHCLFKSRRQKLLSRSSQSHKLCQKRLHDQISYPSFPIEFKLMVLYKIWAFVLFYTFQYPQVLIIVLLLLIFLHWNDKKNVYTHYKMQAFLPIELEEKFEQIVIYFLMAYLCFSYMIVAEGNTWQFYAAPVITVLALVAKKIIHVIEVKQQMKEQEQAQKGLSLANILETLNDNSSLFEQLVNEESVKYSISSYVGTTSMKTANSEFLQGYKQSYEAYIHPLKNKRLWEMLDYEFRLITGEERQNRRESQLVPV